MAAGSCCRCLAGCGRVAFVLINIPFLLLGLAFITLGAAILANASFLSPITSTLQSALDSLTSSLSSGGITIDTSAFKVSDLLQPAAIGILVLGIVLFIIAVSGCLGGCCEIAVLLVIYIIALIILLLAQIIIVACIYAGPTPFDSTLKSSLKSSLESDYKGIEGTDTVSLGWNAVMQAVGCCGLDSYTDFSTATNWPTTITYSGTTVNLQMPVACCSTIDSNLDCTKTSSSLNHKDTGCYTEVWSRLLSQMRMPAVIAGIVLILVVQAIFITLGVIILYVKSQKSKVDV